MSNQNIRGRGKKVDETEHIKIIEATAPDWVRERYGVSVKKTGKSKLSLEMGRSINTIRSQRIIHELNIIKLGYCPLCKKGGGLLAEVTITSIKTGENPLLPDNEKSVRPEKLSDRDLRMISMYPERKTNAEIAEMLVRVRSLKVALTLSEKESELLDSRPLKKVRRIMENYEHCLVWVLGEKKQLGVEP